MEDEFDQNYEDELEAMRDFEEPETMSPKPKRSLQFHTPKHKGQENGDSQLLSLRSPMAPINGSLFRENDNAKRTPLSENKKRPRAESGQSDSELEYDDEDFNRPAPVIKRSRTEQVDEDELWGDDLDQPVKATNFKHLHGSNKVKQYAPVTCEEDDSQPSPDKILIDRIVEYRNQLVTKELKFNREHANRNDRDRLVDDYDFERQRVFKRIPNTSYMATTGTSGDRVYMKLKEDIDYDKQFDSVGKEFRGSQLLSIPITVLKEQLENERQNFLLAATERLSEEVNRQLDEEDQGDMEEDDEDNEDEDKENRVSVTTLPSETQKHLWVEKYAPRRYTDLLSDESINRSLLAWLKNWDYIVFDKELPVKNIEKKKEEPTKFKGKFQPQVVDELDKFKRPTQLISLLCGPPGLGKTTLAHIIAKHAGYNIVEMNASDDRSAEVFKTRIEAATQMKAVFGANPRPNCLIIDEIDGAPQAAINVLLNLLKKTDNQETTKKKKKEEGTILKRPIICICNDQYVPALRQLRQSAMVFNFPQTEPVKLAGRLYEVVRFEKLRTDMQTLMALCEKTDNDIRSCLNTLQFIQRQCTDLSVKNIQSLTIGQKDSHRSLFNVWHEVFSLPRPKRQKYVNLQDAGMKDLVLNTSPGARFKNVLSIVQGAGEYDKLGQGLFENYLEAKFKDPHMDGVTLATEWLCFNDVIQNYIMRVQDYSLMPYLPFLSVTYHFLFASNSLLKIQYPHSFTENRFKKKKCENLVSCMMADMAPITRKFINVPVVVMEILPPMLEIIQPSFRPVNTQLYSAKEKEDLANLVQIMMAYNMTYHQEKSLEGQYNYVLEPHVDEVVKLQGMKQHRQLSYASKQLVAREVQIERMRKNENARMGPQQNSVKPVEGETSKSDEKPADKPVLPNHLMKLTAKPLEKEEDVPIKDFFGRVIKNPTLDTTKTTTTTSGVVIKKNILATDIWFHFQGGYTNAVRRTVKVKDFF